MNSRLMDGNLLKQVESTNRECMRDSAMIVASGEW
jgi:hypothetical protein